MSDKPTFQETIFPRTRFLSTLRFIYDSPKQHAPKKTSTKCPKPKIPKCKNSNDMVPQLFFFSNAWNMVPGFIILRLRVATANSALLLRRQGALQLLTTQELFLDLLPAWCHFLCWENADSSKEWVPGFQV